MSGVSKSELTTVPGGRTALELLAAARSGCIVTLAQELDTLLGGGIPLGRLTELCTFAREAGVG